MEPIEPIPDEADYLQLSGLQHYLFCPRQWALIHIEQQWAENRWTAEGRLMHDRADEPALEIRGDVWTVRALRLASAELRLSGIADVVEFHRLAPGDAGYEDAVSLTGEGGPPLLLPKAFLREGPETRWRVFPVEYKRGKPKANRCDEVQLCAQAMCLEEMLGARIPAGALFYGRNRRRTDVPLDDALRALTREAAAGMTALFQEYRTPPAVYGKHCESCSLKDICLPRKTEQATGARAWLDREIARAAETEGER